MSKQSKEQSLYQMLEQAKAKYDSQPVTDKQLREDILKDFLDGVPGDVLLPYHWPHMDIMDQLKWAAQQYYKAHPDKLKEWIQHEGERRMLKRKSEGYRLGV